MKIAFVAAEVPFPDNSGGRKYTWERIKILSSLNNEVFLYCIQDGAVLKEHEYEMGKYCQGIRLYQRRKKKIDILLNIKKPFSAYSRYNEKMQKQIEIDIRNNKIELLIIDIPQLMYNIPQKCTIPIVLTQHNIEYKTFINIGKKSKSVLKKIFYLFEGYKLKKFEEGFYNKIMISLFTFISKEDKCVFEKKYNIDSTVLIPMGAECMENIKHSKQSSNIIVFVGKMSYYPNEEAAKWFCNNILPDIKLKFPNIKFYIVGKDPSKDLLDLENETIKVTGTVENVNEFIDMADIIVIPLLSGGGVKIKLLEALSRNKIVVTTSKGVEGTEFKDGEHVIVSNNEKDFAEKCNIILGDINKYSYLL